MAILANILEFFKNDRVKEFKAITEEWRAIKDTYKDTAKEQSAQVDRLQKLVEINSERMNQLIELERECNKTLVKMVQQNRDIKEELIFIKKMKNG